MNAVLFDYGLVLCTAPHPPAWERMRTLLGFDEETLHRRYWDPRVAYDRGTLNGREFWQHVAGEPLAEDVMQQLLDADTELWTQPNEAMIQWAADLQKAGITTGILSNLGDAMEAGVRARFDWFEAFDHLTFSHNLRMGKPDLAIYQHAAQGLGLPPSEILFIDDRTDNIEGAQAAGMQTMQYLSHDQFVRDMESAGLGYLLNPGSQAA